MLSHKLAKQSKPFSDGEFLTDCMVEAAIILCPENKAQFENVSLSRRTVTRRVEVIDEELSGELSKKAEDFTYFSIALDESTDIKDTAQLLIFIRGINDRFEIVEEFLAMESMRGTTRGSDLYDKVSGCLERLNLPWTKLLNVTTDGSPNLTGKNVGLLQRIQDRVREDSPNSDLIFLHYIIHQEALCKSVLELDHVAKTVVKLVNFIRARGLNHRQFIQLLEESETEHTDVLYHSNVCWLSLGKVFRRVWDLRGEIWTFLETVGKADEFADLQDPAWLCDFAFGVDVMSHLNDLNLKLQGKNMFVHELYSFMQAFKAKLTPFSQQMTNKCFTHFPTLDTMDVPLCQSNSYSITLTDLHSEFNRRFSDFAKIEHELDLVSSPFSFDREKAPVDVQLELIDIQCDPALKEKFTTSTLDHFYCSLKETQFPNMRRHAQRMLVLFGSTYVCEQTFSVMNYNKSRYRSRLTDKHLSSVLRISTSDMTPDFDDLAKRGDRLNCSH
ncbi:general transcription factor II-I repeat domain-containing protein 2-like [Notolabrus celidotus]|uniref:general transcription factor II-I repeat domain-containing protein 2-like n=1 Tax=Notolabrus celidotus TaxID=1203425 RepID=UPI0014903DE8|nr:general transcription factor II-I repeat domain-containing protein 2-like [Notolabrus celidotus]